MSHYLLGEHVRACAIGEQVVLLDVRRNKYLALAQAQCSGLDQLVADWPRLAGSATREEAHAKVLAGRMLANGLLRTASSDAMPPQWPTLPEVTGTVVGEYADTTVRAGLRQTSLFVQSILTATVALKLRGLEFAVRWASGLRPRNARDEVSLEAAQQAVSVYERLRPLAYTARDECLFDSLALLAFLARQGMYPRLAIGIRTGPFGAHSWVQSGHTVLNDLPERVRKFRPILVI